MNLSAHPSFPEAATTEPDRLVRFFERTVKQGMVHYAMGVLFSQLDQLRRESDDESWRAFAASVGGALRNLTNRDPLSGRCVAKPRGYAGDAATLDIIYRHLDAPTTPSTLDRIGHSILEFTNNRPATSGVRMRRQVLADAIDAAAERSGAAEVLSLACGHLREAETSDAVRAGDLRALYAVDQDPQSLARVTAAHRWSPVVPVHMGVRDLLKGSRPAHDLDLAYSAGLYDYLDDDVAQKTTAALFDMVKPGGQVLVANFHPDLPDIGYMEACMDWWLIYRDENALRRVFGSIPSDAIDTVHVWVDAGSWITYALATKR